jgi:YbgC/YbaW family acyl-CoA thioester hydrolase
MEDGMSFETRFTIEWGDCDENGIVFYPNYFYWLDCTFQRWLRSVGLGQRELRQKFGSTTPIIDVGAKFRRLVRYDDELCVRAAVADWEQQDFRVSYTLEVCGQAVAEGFERRAWVMLSEDRLRRSDVPVEFQNLMS